MVQMPPHFSGPFSAHLQHHVYCSLPISRIIWQCLFQSPQYHPSTNPQNQAGVLPGPFPFIRTPWRPTRSRHPGAGRCRQAAQMLCCKGEGHGLATVNPVEL